MLPIYGGKEYQSQLKALKRGVHVVVGTPGRVMDHLRRGTLRTGSLTTLVLDEADEMLRMGFIEDVEWVLEQIKHEHQTALFSATIPSSIRNVTKRFLKNPAKIHIEPAVTTVSSIEQYYMLVAKKNKLEALTRYLEVEDINAALIFTGTKTFSVEVAEKEGKWLGQLGADIQKTADLVAEISAASIDMNSGGEQINRAIQQLDSVIQQNAASSEEMSSTAVEMSAQAESLQDAVASLINVDTGNQSGNWSANHIAKTGRQFNVAHIEHGKTCN